MVRRHTDRVARNPGPVRPVVEPTNRARFVRRRSSPAADRRRAAPEGRAPPARKTGRIGARVLAELSFRDPVPVIWLPYPEVRRERELARFSLHLVRHRTWPEEPDPLDADPCSGSRPRGLIYSASPGASCSTALRRLGDPRHQPLPRRPSRAGARLVLLSLPCPEGHRVCLHDGKAGVAVREVVDVRSCDLCGDGHGRRRRRWSRDPACGARVRRAFPSGPVRRRKTRSPSRCQSVHPAVPARSEVK